MTGSTARAEYLTGKAHRAVWQLWEESTNLGYEGMTLDLEMVLCELERLQCDLLSKRPPKRLRGPSGASAGSLGRLKGGTS